MRTAEEIKREIGNHRSILAMLPGFSWQLSDIAYHEKCIEKLEQELAELSIGGENDGDK